MPISLRDNDADVRRFAERHDIRTVLDVGAGSGTYADVLAGFDVAIDAVEVWPPYVEAYDLRRRYRHVTVGDIRELPRSVFYGYDLVVFGDVCEHMTEAEMVTVVDRAREGAEWVLVSLPTVHWPQGAEGGNPYEAHVQEDVDPARLAELLGRPAETWLYERTGTFIWKGWPL